MRHKDREAKPPRQVRGGVDLSQSKEHLEALKEIGRPLEALLIGCPMGKLCELAFQGVDVEQWVDKQGDPQFWSSKVKVEILEMKYKPAGCATIYSGVLNIHNSHSEEEVEKMWQEHRKLMYDRSTTTGRLRCTAYFGPPGTSFTLGSDSKMNYTQQCRSEWLKICDTGLNILFFQILEKVYNTDRFSSLGYTVTDNYVTQALNGTGPGSAYQRHKDVYPGNTATDIIIALPFLKDDVVPKDKEETNQREVGYTYTHTKGRPSFSPQVWR
jgi:hypothetical protein